MRIDFYIHNSGENDILKDLAAIKKTLSIVNNKMDTFMTREELVQALTGVKQQVDKVKQEITDKLAALEQAITDAGNTTPEVDQALTDLKASVQSVDDINPDAQPEPPVDNTGGGSDVTNG